MTEQAVHIIPVACFVLGIFLGHWGQRPKLKRLQYALNIASRYADFVGAENKSLQERLGDDEEINVCPACMMILSDEEWTSGECPHCHGAVL